MKLVAQVISIGCNKWKEGSFKNAKIAFEYALDRLNKIGRSEEIDITDRRVDLTLRLAHVHIALKDYDKALNYIAQTQEVVQSESRSKDINTLLGYISFQRGNLLEAAKHYDKALAGYCSSDQDKDGTAAARIAMKVGLAFQKLGRYHRAIEAYDAAVTRFSANKDLKMLAITLSRQAQCLVNLNEITEAAILCGECVSLVKDLIQDMTAGRKTTLRSTVFLQYMWQHQRFSLIYFSQIVQ